MKALRRVVKGLVGWFRPAGVDRLFATGAAVAPHFAVEIINDDKTTMEFVVNVLQRELALDRHAAVVTMLHVHEKGSALISVENLSEAERAAKVIVDEARRHGFPLVCRAVSAQQAVTDVSTETLGRNRNGS